VRAALVVLVAQGGGWPSRRKLADRGLDGLHRAMARRGRTVWKAELERLNDGA